MVNKKEIAILSKEYEKQARESEWCDLAGSIITLEMCVAQEKDSNHLKILELKLEIFEKEKAQRVFSSFDLAYFLSKDDIEYDTEYP